MSIQLLNNRVAIRQDNKQTTSQGGIIITKPDAPLTGTVVSVGKGIYLQNGTFIETVVKIGDKVIYPPNTGKEMNVDGETLLIMAEHELVGILT